jgi:hypothetical protein
MGLFKKSEPRPEQVERLADAFLEMSTSGLGKGQEARAEAVYEAVRRNSTPAEQRAAADRWRSF